MAVLTFLSAYWWAVGIVVLLGIAFGLRKFASKRVQAFVQKYIDDASKTMFTAGDVGVQALADEIYGKLPKRLRLLVPRAVFDVFVKDAYNMAKKTFLAKRAASEAVVNDKTTK